MLSGKNFTIDFGGHTYTLKDPGAGSAGTESNGFQFLKDSTITLKNGTVRIAEGTISIKRIIQNYANLTLEDMHFFAEHQADGEDYALSFNNGSIIFKGDTDIVTTATKPLRLMSVSIVAILLPMSPLMRATPAPSTARSCMTAPTRTHTS